MLNEIIPNNASELFEMTWVVLINDIRSCIEEELKAYN